MSARNPSLLFHVFPLALTALLALAGCSVFHEPDSGVPAEPAKGSDSPGPVDVPQTIVGSDWTPQDFKLKCAESSCPQAVGVLVIAKSRDKGTVSLNRCTAFLVSPTQIISSGHCELDATSKGFFIVRGAKGGVQFSPIAKLLHRTFVENQNTGFQAGSAARLTSGRPDLSVFELNQPITDAVPLALNITRELTNPKLIAYVVNADADKKQSTSYVIESRNCLVHRHEAIFPFDLSESPDVSAVFNCALQPGNSGSPLLNERGEVEMVLQAAERGDEVRKNILKYENRVPLAYEIHDKGLAVNLRCLDFLNGDPSRCTVADTAETERRFAEFRKKIILDYVAQPRSDASQFNVGFETFPYQLKTPSGDQEIELELSDMPKCRRDSADLTSVPFLSRQVKMVFDQWATPSLELLQEARASAEVLSHHDDVFELKIAWPAHFGEFIAPEQDQRLHLHDRFSIALPLCPR